MCGIWSTTHCLPSHKNLILQGSLFLYITARWPVYCFFSFSPTLHCWFWGDTPLPRAKEKPEQDGRRVKIMFRIKPHILQRHSEGPKIPSMHQDPETLQRLRQNCVWVSSEEVWILKLKLQYFGHLMLRADSFEKTPMLGKIEGRRRGDDGG